MSAEDWNFTPDEARARGRQADQDSRWVDDVRKGVPATEGPVGDPWREVADELERLGLERGSDLSQDRREVWAPRLGLDP